jgi:hypothetical protein
LAALEKEQRMLLRWYSRIVGVVLVLLGLAGLLGIETFDRGDALLFVATASIFLYASMRSMGPTQTRSIVGGMGVLYGLVGAFVLVVSLKLGIYSEMSDLVSNVVEVGIGVVCICGALFLPCEDNEPPVDPKALLLLRGQRGNREGRWYQRRR